jgi:ABC-type phosphate transport system substrate-binding protein
VNRVRSVGFALTMLAAMVAGVLAAAPGVQADTDPGTLVGEGGAFLAPVINKLVNDDGTGLTPLNPSYANVKLDQGIGDFVGSAPGQFATDYAVSERSLTSTEAGAAKANGRAFAYVPFAATPVAVDTLVPNPTKYSGQATISSSEFCQHIPLSTALLGDLYGFNASQPLLSWNDARLQCASGSNGTPYSTSVSIFANADPTVENQALMALLDSDPTSKQLFLAGLSHFQSVSTDPTPSENWPYAQGKVPGGDQPLIGKLLNISTSTNAPDTLAANWQLGAIVAMSSVWTGSPLGVPWDIPTAAIQNAQGAFVSPSTAAATAAENDATLAATQDSTTNNLVTFNASATDAAAYNNYLMVEDYLVVPSNGLPAVKASKLAQLVRFVLGPTGQKDIASFGAAPATPAMVTAGLKVAAHLDAESLAATASGSGSGSGSGSASNALGSASGSGAPSAVLADNSASGSADSSGGGGGLAFSGGDPWPTTELGAALFVLAGLVRWRLKRMKLPAPAVHRGRNADQGAQR